MLKKITSLLIAFALVFTATVFSFDNCSEDNSIVLSASAETYGDYNYDILSDGNIRITKYNGKASDIIIPSAINGRKVTSIGDMTFSMCDTIESITIPDSVTDLGDMTFAFCIKLSSVAIPSGVKSIGMGTFAYCTALESIAIPESVTSIGDTAFAFCNKLSDVKLPEGVTSIGEGAFGCCSSLRSMTIPGSVKSIGEFAFLSCESLVSVTIPGGVADIGKYAFGYAYNSSSDKYTRLDNCTILCYFDTEAERYAISNDIDYVLLGDNALYGKVTASGKPAPDAKVSLKDANGNEHAISISADGTFSVDTLPDGTYTFAASKGEHIAYSCTFSVENGKARQSVNAMLKLTGDVSGDGKITAVDSAIINAYVMKTGGLDDYDQKVADVTGDGKVTAVDCSRINAHVQKTNILW